MSYRKHSFPIRCHRFVAVALLLAMLVVVNIHLPVLQVAAWVGMLFSYSQKVELAEAVEMTFNGENPCPMCTAIKQAQTQASDHDESLQAETATRLLLFYETAFVVAPFFKGHDLAATPDPTAHIRAERPEVPPPRVLS
jgi:hypothetical protein